MNILYRAKPRPEMLIEHDIRNALSCIRAAAGLLSERCACPGDEGILLLSGIEKNCEKVSELLDSLTVLLAGDGGCPVVEETDLFKLVLGVVEEFAGKAAARGVSVSVEVPPLLPKVAVNRLLIGRAVTNLVDNAVKYTHPGGHVSVSLGKRGPEGERCIAICIADDGPGIPQDERDNVFECLYRSPSTSHIEGHGLGLAVVRAAVEAHGGSVELKSKQGAGCEFELVLPIRPVGV